MSGVRLAAGWRAGRLKRSGRLLLGPGLGLAVTPAASSVPGARFPPLELIRPSGRTAVAAAPGHGSRWRAVIHSLRLGCWSRSGASAFLRLFPAVARDLLEPGLSDHAISRAWSHLPLHLGLAALECVLQVLTGLFDRLAKFLVDRSHRPRKPCLSSSWDFSRALARSSADRSSFSSDLWISPTAFSSALRISSVTGVTAYRACRSGPSSVPETARRHRGPCRHFASIFGGLVLDIFGFVAILGQQASSGSPVGFRRHDPRMLRRRRWPGLSRPKRVAPSGPPIGPASVGGQFDIGAHSSDKGQ